MLALTTCIQEYTGDSSQWNKGKTNLFLTIRNYKYHNSIKNHEIIRGGRTKMLKDQILKIKNISEGNLKRQVIGVNILC